MISFDLHLTNIIYVKVSMSLIKPVPMISHLFASAVLNRNMWTEILWQYCNQLKGSHPGDRSGSSLLTVLEHPVISQESPMPPPQEPLQRVPVSFCVPRSPVGQGQWKENMRTHQKNDALHHSKSDSKSTPSWYRVTSVIFFDDRQYIILSKTSLARIPEFIKKKKSDLWKMKILLLTQTLARNIWLGRSFVSS